MTAEGREAGDGPGEPAIVLPELISRLASGVAGSSAEAELQELGRRLGGTPVTGEEPRPEPAGDPGPC